MIEKGPIYGGELLASVPLPTGNMRQALPTLDELTSAHDDDHVRLVAGYEILLAHYRVRPKDCGWERDAPNGAWVTGCGGKCGSTYCETIYELGITFCPYCGGKIVEESSYEDPPTRRESTE